MNKDREEKMGELKQQIEAGEYRVDPAAVADAIVRRLRDVAVGRTEMVTRTDRVERLHGNGQSKCSYPTSSPSLSTKTTPAGPSTTDPITVRSKPRRSWFDGVIAGFVHTLAGTQAHSS
jgi:Anti-sigma-28 factor, FlgM